MRYRGIRRPRKMRPSITVKQKAAPRDGKCTGCSGVIHKGEQALYIRTRVKRYHLSCQPANPYATAATMGAPALPSDPMEAMLRALEALENALVVKAKKTGITPELEKHFDKYQKLKAVALRPGTPGEERVAFRMAVLEAVKAVF